VLSGERKLVGGEKRRTVERERERERAKAPSMRGGIPPRGARCESPDY